MNYTDSNAAPLLEEPTSTVLLPKSGGNAGGNVLQQLTLAPGDRVALATCTIFERLVLRKLQQ